ncbi:hypothetical protein [Photobacterium carnosum]|uniref:hypothetical protein n=1 Tax=Photobacterium carnosum TaxID=2023717 RepID=UPI001E36C0E6|nr:hypothetical protein [Photobacterium carnosum]MCD9500349.1 hypothetical protein [Photobacterium carnosum]
MKKLMVNKGITLIKSGDFELNNLSDILKINGLNSSIAEITVSNSKKELTIGHFIMTPGSEFEYIYDSIEFKVITKGTIIAKDIEGHKFIAHVGDVLLFTANTKVIFDGDSDGEAIYGTQGKAAKELHPKNFMETLI